MRITTRMPSFEGVVAGQTASVKLPIGRRYHNLFLTYAGVTLAQMTEIRIYCNAKVIQRFSATWRDKVNQFDGLAAANGVLTIPFDRIGLKQRAAEELTAINTGVLDSSGRGISAFYVEVDIDGAATAPAFTLKAEQSEAVAGGAGLVEHIRQFPRSAAGAGELEISDMPYNSMTTASINRIVYQSALVTEAKLERAQHVIFERTKAENDVIQGDGIRTPQSGYYIIDTTERGYGGELIDTVGYSDFRAKLEMSGAGTVTVGASYVAPLGD